jgi:hypothetical protein
MRTLPTFKPRAEAYVRDYLNRVFINPQVSQDSHLREFITYPDGHYRAVFMPSYFVLAASTRVPTKSQWNTLKKRFKRLNSGVFVFKEHGTIRCHPTDNAEDCLYIDFGFFAH